MNALLRRVASSATRRQAFTRGLQTGTYVPQAGLRDVDPPPAPRGPRRTKPSSPSFYTGRAGFNDALGTLEEASHQARTALRTLQLLPLPAFARAALPPRRPVWKSRREMGGAFQGKLSTTRYRRALDALTALDEYRLIAATAHVPILAQRIADVLTIFERDDKAAVLARGKRKPVVLDQFGRSYTVGRRKTSAARAWVIPVKLPAPVPTEAAPVVEAAAVPSILDYGAEPTPATPPAPEVPVVPSTILVNGVPLAQYFPLPADRERIVRPLKVTGLLGAFNIFALVRGGGTSGQSGAVTQAIAKGIAAHDPQVEPILRKCPFDFLILGITRSLRFFQRNSSVVILAWSSVRRPDNRRLAPEYVSLASRNALVLTISSVHLGQALDNVVSLLVAYMRIIISLLALLHLFRATTSIQVCHSITQVPADGTKELVQSKDLAFRIALDTSSL
jgi:small subunit ribosomal protein S9